MIDEFFQKNAGRVARSVSETTKSAVSGTGNALYHALARFSAWFDNFRWIEFSAAVTASMAAGLTMATSLHLSEPIAQKIGAFGAIVTAIAFVRSPKTKWEKTDNVQSQDDE